LILFIVLAKKKKKKKKKKIKAFIPTELKGPGFHCPYYVKKLSNDNHLAYKNSKPFSDNSNVDADLNLFSIIN